MTTEPLEARRLLAGVTLLTHGYNGNVNGWVATAAADIQDRAGGDDAASIYTMTVKKSGSKLAVTGFTADKGEKDYRTTTAGELIVKLDWSTVSDGSYTTQAVASVVNDYMLDSHNNVPPMAELPIQLIGHSRGASLVSALSQDLGQAGVWVDQVTFLDPHPVDGKNDFFGVSFGDAKMNVYDNTAFADNYWRTDGDPNNSDFDGERVNGTYQGDLNSTVQKNFFVSAHGAVPAYYIGTIDTGTSDGGDHPVLSSWYKGTKDAPSRNTTGYVFSRIGSRTRPASGVSEMLAGEGERTAAGQDGSQWANVFNFVSRGNTTIASGTTITTQFLVADRDSRSRVQVYYDTDTNPYNGATSITSKPFASSTLLGGRLNVGTTGIRAGSYYLAAESTDDSGHERWSYSPLRIKVTPAVAPDFAKLAGGVLTLTGTDEADKITLSQTSSQYTFTLNGATQSFAVGSVDTINVQAGTGNDTVDGSGLSKAFYVNAGPGFDNVVGGAGPDTLSGGAQSDTIIGGLGDDALSGNGGNNLLVGNGGYDRLYGSGGNDTLIGSSNSDRFFGGSGDESMIGGPGNDRMYGNAGNDTLIGGEGGDLLAGGSGRNTADNDPLDLRTEIQVLL